MTIKELKQKIADLPDNMDVFVDERYSEFKYGLVNSTYTKNIDFYEDPWDETPLASGTVLILTYSPT